MRCIAIAIPLAFVLTAGAQAGEMPATSRWSGIYLGGNVGHGVASASADFNVLGLPAIAASEELSGAVYGGQIGYNFQTGALLLGIETDFMATSQKASNSRQCLALACGIAITQTSEDSIPWLGTTRLRIGGTLGPALVYGTGGVGYGAFKSTQTLTSALASVTSTSEEQRLAWVAGGGMETALDDHWSVRVEYLHIDAGNNTTTYSLAGVGLITQQSRMVEDIVRFGVNYRF